MDLTKYAALNVKVTEYSKVNSQFSIGRCRVFYEGPNVNRTIIDSDTAKNLIKTIPGTPIVGRFNSENDDFEGHGEGQVAYGFVPLDPNPLKVEVTEEILGLPIKRTYYEVDAVIWDGRFPEAKKILEEEKSLSMELNPDTLEGEFEIYDDKHYLKITNAEFFGITVLGDGHTPCFKDAKFFQTYASMLSAYEALTKEQESNIGGTNMPDTEEKVEVVENDTTITNEEAPVETEETPVEEVTEETTEEEAAEETPTEEGTEEETEAEEVTEEEVVTEEAPEAEHEEGEEAPATEEVVEEVATETEEPAEETSEPEVVEEAEADSAVNEETEALKAQVEELTSKLETYETAAKEELVAKFSSKINDSEFMSEVKDNLSSYSVESLKATLGAKLAEQVLVEETGDEEKVNGMVYSFNGAAKKDTTKGWQNLVRASKEAANKKN